MDRRFEEHGTFAGSKNNLGADTLQVKKTSHQALVHVSSNNE